MGMLLARGGFADVVDLGDGTVAKLYRRMSHTNDAPIRWSDHDLITSKLCGVEANTYQRLRSHPDVQPFIPCYFGLIEARAILLPLDLPTDQYVAGYGIRLEKLAGRDTKVAHVRPDLRAKAEVILEVIRDSVGDLNVWDSSCFVPGSRSEFCLIDFALWDGYVDITESLAMNGVLSARDIQLLSL